MSYNPGGWNEEKIKYLGLALLVAVVLAGLAHWAGLIHVDIPPPPR